MDERIVIMFVAFEILIILLLILINGFFSMSEISILASRKSRLQQSAAGGNRKALTALDLANAPNRFLSTIQIGITLVGILSGAIGGATLTRQLQQLLLGLGIPDAFAEVIALSFVVLCITYLTVVFGELVPKRIALNHPERVAKVVAGSMRRLSVAFSPFVGFLSGSIDSVLKWMHLQKEVERSITDDEIRLLIAQAAQTGVVEKLEQDLLNRVLRLGDLRISVIMTPRSKIKFIDLNESVAAIQNKIMRSNFSRFPVCANGIGHVLGVASAKELLVASQTGQISAISNVVKPVSYVPESQRILKLLELFKQSAVSMVFVIDEYGSIEGLVTLHDVMEAIAGEIGEEEVAEPQVIRREDGSLLLDGRLLIEDLKAVTGIPAFPDEEKYHTLGGLVITHLSRIPISGDQFEWNGFRFEVIDMDGKRVDKVLASKIQESSSV